MFRGSVCPYGGCFVQQKLIRHDSIPRFEEAAYWKRWEVGVILSLMWHMGTSEPGWAYFLLSWLHRHRPQYPFVVRYPLECKLNALREKAAKLHSLNEIFTCALQETPSWQTREKNWATQLSQQIRPHRCVLLALLASSSAFPQKHRTHIALLGAGAFLFWFSFLGLGPRATVYVFQGFVTKLLIFGPVVFGLSFQLCEAFLTLFLKRDLFADALRALSFARSASDSCQLKNSLQAKSLRTLASSVRPAQRVFRASFLLALRPATACAKGWNSAVRGYVLPSLPWGVAFWRRIFGWFLVAFWLPCHGD